MHHMQPGTMNSGPQGSQPTTPKPIEQQLGDAQSVISLVLLLTAIIDMILTIGIVLNLIFQNNPLLLVFGIAIVPSLLSTFVMASHVRAYKHPKKN